MSGVTYPRQGWSDYGIESDLVHRIAPQKPVIGGIYRHFKGGLYQVLYFAKDESEPKKELIVYRNLMYGDTWVRELANFESKVDKDKYPDVEQENRFEYVGKPQYIMMV